jgi:hypothetical protein
VIRLLALDVDGTLAHRGDEILPATREALQRARSAGIEVAIATGRRYRTTRRVIENLGFDVASVSLGGTLVKEADGTTLHRRTLAPQELVDVLTLYREAGQAAIGQRDGHDDGGADFVLDGALPWNGWTSRYAEANREYCEWHRDLAAEGGRDDVIELCGFGPEAELASLEARVQELHPGRFETVLLPMPESSSTRGGFFLEVRPAGACKWSGLSVLLEDRGLVPQAVCAVGDERNDLSMVAGAGLGVAMGNAHPELSEAADWVTGRHDEDGLVAVVERLLAQLG